jgi:hypothetical protein
MSGFEYGRTPESVYAEFTAAVGPERKGSPRVVVAERWGYVIRRVLTVPQEEVVEALPHTKNLARIVLDARVPYEVQDRLREVAEKEDVLLKVIEMEAPAPLADALPLGSWRVQAALFLRELRQSGRLELPTEKALTDQFRSMDLIRGAGGKLAVTPGVLPMVDAILLTLQPLLRTESMRRMWIGR